jgi:hypothetical protein
MLFYETEGEFGDESFKITAKGLFLLDIGTHSYTEYDPADPDLIKFLMANPEVLAMKKGHIHSHNSMAVFFSGTDNEELIDNCIYHNFYLSLIVNNRNEMCAKIAFQAKSTHENHLTISYMNQEGKEKQKKLVGKKESESAYVYKCEIFKPGEVVEDSFKSRFQELKEARETKEKTRKTLEAAYKTGTYKGFNVDERWRQAGLFDDVKGSSHFPQGKKEWEKFRGTKEEVGTGGKGISVVERVGNMRTDPRVYTMLGKLLSLDFLYEGTLSNVIKKLDNEFFSLEGDLDRHASYELHLYCDAIETRATEFYIDAFPEDCQKLLFFDSTMERCIEILETYEDEYPELITNLTEALNLEIQGK